jgi:hypothetical protein
VPRHGKAFGCVISILFSRSFSGTTFQVNSDHDLHALTLTFSRLCLRFNVLCDMPRLRLETLNSLHFAARTARSVSISRIEPEWSFVAVIAVSTRPYSVHILPLSRQCISSLTKTGMTALLALDTLQ